MIGAHIIYNMWKNVGQRPTFVMVGESEEKKEKTSQVLQGIVILFFLYGKHCNIVLLDDWFIEKIDLKRLDWSGSALGLFLGLLALVVLEKIFLVQNFFSCRYFFVLKNSSCSSCPSPCSPRSP